MSHAPGSHSYRLLNGRLECDLHPVPSAPKELHALVVLLLNSGQIVSRQTLTSVMFPEEGYGIIPAEKSGVNTPLSRLRTKGWPIEPRFYRLAVDRSEVDILDFDDRASAFLTETTGRSASDAQLAELVQRGRALIDEWSGDPVEAWRDYPEIVVLFESFTARLDRLLARVDELESLLAIDRSPDPRPLLPLQDGLATYFRDVLKRAMTLAFGTPGSWSAQDAGDDPVTLDDLWTPLRVADSQQRSGNTGTLESMTEGDGGADLVAVFDSTTEPLLILGEPGSGKSTTTAMLAARFARTGSTEVIPIWVNLGSVVAHPRWSAEKLLFSGVPEIDHAVARKGEHAGVDLSAQLEAALVSGRAVLLLDGLDEVKDHALGAVVKAIGEVLARSAGSRVVVTCRSFDYRQSEPSRKVPIVRELELLPLRIEEKEEYVARWYTAARAGGFRTELANELRDALQSELRGNRVIAEMADLPLLLALITLIHSRQDLPNSRSVIYDQAIRYMLAETPPWRERKPGATVEATGAVVRLASEVAFRRHCEEELDDAVERVITRELVLEEATKIVDSLQRAGTGRAAPTPEQLTAQFENSHGLLLASGPNRYRFAHRYFQEYLAGQHYARGRARQQAVERGQSIHWREPFRLMASFAAHNGDNLLAILDLIDGLLQTAKPAGEHLAGEMLGEIGRPRLALWDFEHVLEADEDGEGLTGLWERARNRISRHVESWDLTLPERERSGNVVALLGDPRFVEDDGTERATWTHLVEVAGGNRSVGTERVDPETVRGGFVAPVRRVVGTGFRIGRYPVTNAEFAAFIAAGGYSELDFWASPRGRNWAQGDEDTLSELRQNWLSTVHEHHAKEIRDGEIDALHLEREAERRTAQRGHPYYWYDTRFNRPNQPVVGVNFWEAEAFCAWATASARESGQFEDDVLIALPTEFQWESAARRVDDDRIYPWGDDWDESRALVTTNSLNLRAPSTVGIYAPPWDGAPMDMAGNVWEWTASLFHPYDPSFDDLRDDSNSLEERVVRGGSWYNFGPMTACSVRAVDRSYNLFYDVGFRITLTEGS